MDFLHRNANGQPQPARTNGGSTAPAAASTGNGNGGDKFKKALNGEPKWLRVVFLILLLSLTVLAVAIAMLFYFGNKSKESGFVDQNKFQAVFLTNGQVYFGRVTEVTSKYVNLQNIYYLNSQQQPAANGTQSTSQQTNFSLVKLGCELHGPADQMIINREQVSFWENLTSNGKVAKAIDQWVQQNPDGQKCDASSNTTQPNGTTGTGTENKQQ